MTGQFFFPRAPFQIIIGYESISSEKTKMVARPLNNPRRACGFNAHLQAMLCLPGMDVFVAFTTFMAQVIVDKTQTHRCMTIVKAMERMLDTSSNGAIDVVHDYDGDMHSLFVDRGVLSINDAMRVSMDVTYDLIVKTICVKGLGVDVSCNKVFDIMPETLYVSDLSETHIISDYVSRMKYMQGLGLQMKSIVLKCDGYHFIALAMWGDRIYEYNDSRIVRTFESWQEVIHEPRFRSYLVTSAWYYRQAGRVNSERIWNAQLNASFAKGHL